MGLISAIENAVRWVGGKIVDVVDCTLDVCRDVAQATADAIQWVQDKVNQWRPKNSPVERVHPNAKAADEKLIEPVINTVKGHFPTGISNFVEQSSETQRVEKLAELVPAVAQTMGITNIPEVEFYVPETEELFTSYGAYNWRDNKLKLNLAMVVSEEKEMFQEQVSTVLHEMIHARQIEAVNAFVSGMPIEEYGYQESYIVMLADNVLNYISAGEDPESYCKQPLESEAFWFESQVKPSLI